MTTTGKQQNRQYQSGRAGDSPQQYCRAFSLTVLFTTVSGTLAALRKGASLAHELGARIEILVVQVVPYALPIDEPHMVPEFRMRQFRTLCEQEPIETRSNIRLCRDARECIQKTLRPHSLVLIGIRRSWWPFTGEKTLARKLERIGHQVILVGCPR